MRRFIIVVLSLIAVAFFMRSFFLWRDFVFVYDQGRDALEVQQILHGHLTLIGPTTGLSGVFLGPFFFYFLVPFYVIGRGNPIIPAYGFALMESLVIIPIFLIAKRMFGKLQGLIAAVIYTVSFSNILFARWLSNPVPLPMISLLAFLSLFQALKTKKLLWFGLTGLLVGICLQLEAANATFFIPAIALIVLVEWLLEKKKRKWLPVVKQYCSLAVGGVVTLLPQLFFELRHGFLSTKALIVSFQTTREGSVLGRLPGRFLLLLHLYSKGVFPGEEWLMLPVVVMLVWIAYQKRAVLFKSRAFRMLLVWFTVPFCLDLLYNGNHGNFWDYYIIAQHVPFYLLIGAIATVGLRSVGKIRVVAITLVAFMLPLLLATNGLLWGAIYRPYTERISLSLQLDAIHWTIQQANGEPFGAWEYTPSDQDDPYRYLFSYVGKKTVIMLVEHPEQTKRMFLLVEDDPSHAWRRELWLEEKTKIGSIIARRQFGAVTVFELVRHP